MIVTENQQKMLWPYELNKFFRTMSFETSSSYKIQVYESNDPQVEDSSWDVNNSLETDPI
jgi:hypothetical protein